MVLAVMMGIHVRTYVGQQLEKEAAPIASTTAFRLVVANRKECLKTRKRVAPGFRCCCAEQVLSMSSVEPAATSAAFLVRYHARTALGAPEDVRTGHGGRQAERGLIRNP